MYIYICTSIGNEGQTHRKHARQSTGVYKRKQKYSKNHAEHFEHYY